MKHFFWLLFLPTIVFAWATLGLFNEFPNRYFVETGSLRGEGVIEALRTGFTEIHSIELSPHYHSYCKDTFSHLPHVHFWLGDSATLLEEIIQKIDKPITFWLDGHYSGTDTAKGSRNTPILQELAAIKRHPIKTHTILIDDVRLFSSEEFDHISLSTVKQLILEINPNYVISFKDAFQERDILVATVPSPKE